MRTKKCHGKWVNTINHHFSQLDLIWADEWFIDEMNTYHTTAPLLVENTLKIRKKLINYVKLPSTENPIIIIEQAISATILLLINLHLTVHTSSIPTNRKRAKSTNLPSSRLTSINNVTRGHIGYIIWQGYLLG